MASFESIAPARSKRAFFVTLASFIAALLLVAGISPAASAAPGDASLSVRITGVTGATQTGATVTATRVTDGLEVASTVGAETPAKSGTYVFANLDTGEYALRVDTSVSSTYYGGATSLDQAKVFEVAVGSNTLSFALRGGTLSGKVLTSKSKALKNVDVDLFAWDGAAWELVRTVVSSKTGAYSFANLEPGSYTTRFDATRLQPTYVSVFAGGKLATGTEAVPSSISAASASFVNYGTTTTVTQKLVVGGKITGTVRGATALAGVKIRAVALTGSPSAGWTAAAPLPASVTSSSAGKFTVTGLATGYYALSYSSIPASFSNSFTGLAAPTVIKVTAGKTTAATAAQTTLPVAEQLVSGFPNQQVGIVDGTLTLRNFDGTVADVSALSTDGAAAGHVAVGSYTWEIRATISGVAAMPQYGEITVGAGINNFLFDLVDDVAIDFMVQPSIAETATAVGTTYTVAATSNHPSTTRLDYQWLRDGLPIFGARSATYRAGGGDLGTRLAARVTIVDLENGVDVAATVPAGAGVVTPGAQIATGAVGVSPQTNVYVGTLLRATTESWNLGGLRFSYQWFEGETPLAGATKSTYTVAGTETSGIRVEATAYKAGYATSEAVSSGEIFYEPKPASLTKAPKVTAKKLSGGRTQYTVTGGTWSTKPSVFEYQWRLDGQDVAGATSSKYISTAATRNGATIFVTAYPSKNNYVYEPVEIVASKGTASPYVNYIPGSVTFSETSQAVTDTTPVPIGTALDVEAGAYGHPGTDVAPTLTYQWLRASGSTFVAIKGATGTSYTVSAADAGLELRVKVTGTAPAYPVPTQQIEAGVGALRSGLEETPPTVDVAGSPVVGETVTTSLVGNWALSDVALSYAWASCATNCDDVDATWSAVSGATKSTLKVASSLLGKSLRVSVTGSKPGYTPHSIESPAVEVVASGGSLSVLAQPTIAGLVDGAAPVGNALSVVPPIFDQPGVILSYQWQHCATTIDCDIPQNWLSPQSGSQNRYTPDNYEWYLNDGILRVKVYASKPGYQPTEFTLGGEIPIVAGTPFEIAAPAISQSGSVFTIDGYWAYAPGTAPEYTWKLDGDIAATSGASFTRESSNAGKQLSVEVFISRSNSTYGYSAGDFEKTYLVAKGTAVAPDAAAITGNRVGDTLVAPAQPFTTAGDAGATAETYQWLSAGKPIAGATDSTWVATSTYLGKKITVKRTFTSANFASATVTSLATTLALGGDVGGTPAVTPDTGITPGKTLTVTPAGYSSSHAFSYTWQYSADGSKFTTITKATAKTYKALVTQVGGQLRATVTVKRAGYATVTKTTVAVPVSVTGVLTPTVEPTLAGIDAAASTVKAGTTLSVTAPKFATKATVSYRWLRNGVVVPGLTKSSFTVPGSNFRDELSVEVTAKSAGFDDYVETLGAVTVVRGAAPKASKVPGVTGTIASCTTLSASTGTWSIDGATYTYQWYGTVNGLRVGATGPTYTDQVGGEKLYVVVTADAEGFALGTARSKDSATIPTCAP